jgi:hypothetical protein
MGIVSEPWGQGKGPVATTTGMPTGTGGGLRARKKSPTPLRAGGGTREHAGIHYIFRLPGEGVEPSWVPRPGDLSHNSTDRPEVTEAIVWATQWQGTRRARESGSRTRNISWRIFGTSGASSRPTRTRCTILLRVPVAFGQGVRSAAWALRNAEVLGRARCPGNRADPGDDGQSRRPASKKRKPRRPAWQRSWALALNADLKLGPCRQAGFYAGGDGSPAG